MNEQSADQRQRTPLFYQHQKLGARFVEFSGWEMPLYYTSIVDEHLAVRTAAGIFDISHMGEITVTGAAAAAFLNFVLTNDIRRLVAGRCQYSLLCNTGGGVIDDLYVYQLSDDLYLLVVNAARTEADMAWLESQARTFAGNAELQIRNSSQRYAAVAVQGPRVPEFMDECIAGPSRSARRVARITELKKNEIGGFTVGNANVLVSRTGYTGEDGFEIIGLNETVQQLWETILQQGAPYGIKPCGLGARDTLRTEMCYPLYGHELDEATSPIEAGLDRFVAFDKGEFMGREVFQGQRDHGVAKRLIAFEMIGKSPPPRAGYSIWADANQVGQVTSGIQSPSLQKGIGMGYVPPEIATPGKQVQIEIRNDVFPAQIVSKPIYRKPQTA